MKTLSAVFFLVSSFTVQASGWMTLEILPGSVLTGVNERHIAIIREQHSPYPSENYECTLKLAGDISKVSREYFEGTSWARAEVTQGLLFSDSYTRHEVKLVADRSSECLEWGEEYNEEGFPQRDCLNYKNHFKTVVNILEMRPTNAAAKNLKLEVHCEKWMSEREFTNLDNFFHALYKSKGHFPLNLDLELD